MNADDRLNQLEPLVSEALNVLDRHTLQLKQLNGAVVQLQVAVAQQGDNISFLLREQMAMKTDMAGIKTDIVDMKTDIAGMKTDMADMKFEMTGIKSEMFGVKSDIVGIKTDMAGMNGKLDLLVQLMQGSNK